MLALRRRQTTQHKPDALLTATPMGIPPTSCPVTTTCWRGPGHSSVKRENTVRLCKKLVQEEFSGAQAKGRGKAAPHRGRKPPRRVQAAAVSLGFQILSRASHSEGKNSELQEEILSLGAWPPRAVRLALGSTGQISA